MKISEIITDKYKLRIPPTVYYDLLADVREVEEEQEPTTKNDLGVDREDAVERLNAIKQLIGYDKDSEIVKATQKSLDMAIKALEHPEKNVVAVVPCGDCISREQALKELKESAEYHANDSREEALLRRDRDIIRALPSVTPQEPKTGHYEKHIDHTDCIWYGSDSGCPVTCSQYRDGWNDAMDYIFKNGKGYQLYRHDG